MRVIDGDRGDFLSVNSKKVAIVVPESSSCYVKEGSDGSIKIDGAGLRPSTLFIYIF